VRRLSPLVAFLAPMLSAFGTAAQQQTSPQVPGDPSNLVFQLVLPADHLLGSWGGLRTRLERAGITPRLTLVTDLAGNPSGGRANGVTAPTSVGLGLLFDLDTIFGRKGGSLYMGFSQHWGKALSLSYIGNVFGTQQVYGFETFRFTDVYYQQQLLDDRLELRLGRFAPTNDFLVSAYSCGFVQSAFCGNPPAMGFDAPSAGGSGKWAALVKVKPTRRSYAMIGAYNGDTLARIRSMRHHGLDFSLHGPLFAIGEVAYQVNGLPGEDRRLGNYKLGGWYDQARITEFESGARTRGTGGYYALFDQVFAPIDTAGTNRGVGAFGSVTVAPIPEAQRMSLLVTAGVLARGMSDAHPRDGVALAVAVGQFSEDFERAQRGGQVPGRGAAVQEHETVLELNYRLDFLLSAVFVQPNLQFIIWPGATGLLPNATVLGVQLGVNF